MFKTGIITSSDKGSRGERVDISGQVIREIVESKGYTVERYVMLPDEKDQLKQEMIHMADVLKVDLILTTGGTGFSPRDVTPEATLEVVDRLVPGIPEAMRHYSMGITPMAMLSRSTAGIRNRTLIVNLPGSPKAVRENLESVIDTMHHGLEVLTGVVTECIKK